MLLRERRAALHYEMPRAPRAVSPPREPTAPTVPAQRAECFRAHNRSMMISVAKVPRLSHCSQALRPERTSRSASCCLLAVSLERCCPQARSRAPPVRASARGASTAAGGKSAFGARCARLHSCAAHERKLSPPLSHAIGAELMLGIAYEHDASFAARAPSGGRGDSVIGRGLAFRSQRSAFGSKSRNLASRTSSLRASRRRRSGAAIRGAACRCRPLLTVRANAARPALLGHSA